MNQAHSRGTTYMYLVHPALLMPNGMIQAIVQPVFAPSPFLAFCHRLEPTHGICVVGHQTAIALGHQA